MERVMIFIDGSNFYHGLKNNLVQTQLDFGKLSALLCGSERKLIRTYYYNVPAIKEDGLERYQKQQLFFDQLHKTPYLTLVLGRLEKRPILDLLTKKIIGTTTVEKGVDVRIAVDMLRLAYQNSYDTAILVSGDGDFASVVEAAKDLGETC